MKIVKMQDDTHKKAKATAKKLGMTLQGYLNSLVLKDKR